MKKIYILLVSCLVVLTSSCSLDDFLDQPLKGQQELDDFFSTEENTENFVNGIYKKVNGEGWSQVFQRQLNDMATDDCWSGNTAQPRPDITGIASYNVYAGSTYFNSIWDNYYIGITRANILMDYVETVDLDEDTKNRFIGEALFLRAWFYFELVQNFGGLPIVTTYDELLQPEINDKTRSTVEEVYELIESDLSQAIEYLPLKSEYAAADAGRATQGAAQSLLAKVYLTQEKYTEAQEMTENVINSGEYVLETNFADIYQANHFNGVESIFEVGYINNQVYSNIGGHWSVTSGSRADPDQGWGWSTPTSDLENAFLEEGDLIRLQSTIIKDGDAVYGDSTVTDFDARPSENKSGRINRKYYIPIGDRPDPYQIGQIPLPDIRIRYADVLLMNAEAAYFNGDEGTAKSSLQEVRDRVSLTTDLSLSGDDLRDAIWKERRLELALEQHRLFDLRREKINGVPRIALLMGPDGSFVKYNTEESTDSLELSNQNESQEKGIYFEVGTHLLWPIPPDEIQLSQGNIVQNPGY